MDVLTEQIQMAIEQSEAGEIPAREASTNSATMAELVPLAIAKHGENTALTWKAGDQWQSLSYVEWGERIKRIAKSLIADGVTIGDKIAILGNTRPEWTFCDFGSLCAGATVAPIYQSNSPEECEYVLNHSESKLLFVEDAEQLEKIGSIRQQLKHVERIIVMDSEGISDLGDATRLEDFEQLGEKLDDSAFNDRCAAIKPDDLCTIVYTSGTTGPPKGCMITHENYRATTTMGESTIVGDPHEIVYLYLPLAHVFARLVQFVAFDVGGTLAYWERDPQKIISNVAELRPHAFPSVPRIFEKIYTLAMGAVSAKSAEEQEFFKKAIDVGFRVRTLQQEGAAVPAELLQVFEAADEPVYSLVRNLFGGRVKRAVTGAAPIAQEILEFFFACGVPVFEGYGMTETSTLATANNAFGFKFGSVGRPVEGVTVKIADDGEILIKGANIFEGYYKNLQATAETMTDEWLNTGDLGRIDEDGFVFITGRKKDIIITAGGKNLTPANFENSMKQNRWISQAVMFADRRPYPVALFTLDPEEAPVLAQQLAIEDSSPANLADHPAVRDELQKVLDEVNKKFAPVEQVKKFRVLDHDLSQETGELTPTLKVKRNVVYEKYADVFAGMYDED